MPSKLTFRDTISQMIRTIRIWLLLRNLQKGCHESEAKNPEHHGEEGHAFRACIAEEEFLDESSKGDAKKRSNYADFLDLAENDMKLLDVDPDELICAHCAEVHEIKLIRLNTAGLKFVGISDLIEYLFSNYKTTWSVLIIPILTFFLGVYRDAILGFFFP